MLTPASGIKHLIKLITVMTPSIKTLHVETHYSSNVLELIIEYTSYCSFQFQRQCGAAYWRNHYRNGTGLDLTLHAGCPVLEGYKWGK